MDSPLAQFLLRLLVTGISVLIVGKIVPGIKVKGLTSAVWFAFLVAIINAIAWYLLAPLTWPFALLTLGIGVLIINGFVFWLGGRLSGGVHVSGWFTAMLGSIGVSVCNWALYALTGLSH